MGLGMTVKRQAARLIALGLLATTLGAAPVDALPLDEQLLHMDPVISVNGELPRLPGVAGPTMSADAADEAPQEATEEAPAEEADDATAAEPDQSAMFLPGFGGSTTPTSTPREYRPQTSDPTGKVDRVTSPAPLVRPIMVSATVNYAGQVAPLVFPEEGLPYRFYVERALANRHGLGEVVGAVRQWDGIPGSRWATVHAGVIEERTATATADARSVIFFKQDCPAGVGGYAYWQTATGSADARYGDAAVYILEVDIGVCSAVTTVSALRAVVAHEIGHAIGMEHLCDPGQPCWKDGMGAGPHGCRVMYAGSSSCNRAIGEAERTGAVHNYPTIRRLAGPSRVETAARASFAAFGKRSASSVILARSDGTAHGPLAAAALSGVLDAGFLIGSPSGSSCLSGSAAEELARAAGDPGKVILVGDWPQSCDTSLAGWNLSVERVGAGSDPVALSIDVAARAAASGRTSSSVFIVSARPDASGHVPDGVAAGAAAGANGAPVLFTPPERLGAPVAGWIRGQQGVRRAYVMGGRAAVSDQVVADLRSLGLEVVRVAGTTRVGTAIALASRLELFPTGKPVVLAAASSWADAVTGSATGARMHAPVLVTPPQGEASVEQWLKVRAPHGGYIVGGTKALPYELQWRYSKLVK
jgi:hypothetical protein